MADILARKKKLQLQQTQVQKSYGNLEHRRKQMLLDKQKEVQRLVAQNIAIAKAKRKETELKAKYVKLDTGEYIDRETFEKLPLEEQAQLRTLGIKKYTEATTVALDTGELVDKTAFEELPAEKQSQLRELGIDKYTEATITTLSTGEKVDKEAYESMPQEYQSKLYEMGLDEFNKFVEQLKSTTVIPTYGVTFYRGKTALTGDEAKQIEKDYSRLRQLQAKSLLIAQTSLAFDPEVRAKYAKDSSLKMTKAEIAEMAELQKKLANVKKVETTSQGYRVNDGFLETGYTYAGGTEGDIGKEPKILGYPDYVAKIQAEQQAKNIESAIVNVKYTVDKLQSEYNSLVKKASTTQSETDWKTANEAEKTLNEYKNYAENLKQYEKLYKIAPVDPKTGQISFNLQDAIKAGITLDFLVKNVGVDAQYITGLADALDISAKAKSDEKALSAEIKKAMELYPYTTTAWSSTYNIPELKTLTISTKEIDQPKVNNILDKIKKILSTGVSAKVAGDSIVINGINKITSKAAENLTKIFRDVGIVKKAYAAPPIENWTIDKDGNLSWTEEYFGQKYKYTIEKPDQTGQFRKGWIEYPDGKKEFKNPSQPCSAGGECEIESLEFLNGMDIINNLGGYNSAVKFIEGYIPEKATEKIKVSPESQLLPLYEAPPDIAIIKENEVSKVTIGKQEIPLYEAPPDKIQTIISELQKTPEYKKEITILYGEPLSITKQSEIFKANSEVLPDGTIQTKTSLAELIAQGITPEYLAVIGFKSEDIKNAEDFINEGLLAYKSENGYDITRAIIDGKSLDVIERNFGGKEKFDAVLASINSEQNKYLMAWNNYANGLVEYLDKGVQPSDKKGLVLSTAEINALGRAMDSLGIKPYGSYIATYRKLDDKTKKEVAVLFGSDYTKTSQFASFAKEIESGASKGIGGMLLFGLIQQPLTTIGKQLTLTEAKKQLSANYATEIKKLDKYMKIDNTFDIDKIQNDINRESLSANLIKDELGYEKSDDLIQNLEYYNYATSITPKEWAVASLTGILAIMLAGGGAALSSLGVGGRVAAETLTFTAPVSLGAIQAKDVAKALSSPKVKTGEKVLIGTGEALLFTPLLGTAIRGMQFSRIITRPDYVPMRSMSMEAATMRVPFSEAQIAKMEKAGVSKAEIIKAGTEITKQLTKGKKTASVKLGNVVVKVKNIPYQTDVGGAFFHATPDITVWDRGVSIPIVKEFYSSGKVAIQPLQRSYLTGQRAIKPGILELHVSPKQMAEIAAQRRLISGGKVLEPESVLPPLDELEGLGYRIEIMPGKIGKGVTFDASLGQIEIRRATLLKVTDNQTGLIRIKLGEVKNGGVMAIGDRHANSNFAQDFNDINTAFGEPVISGNPNVPETWNLIKTNYKGRTIVSLGDDIDRGDVKNYYRMREAYNRLYEQAKQTGNRFVRILGNHELAYISNDAIKGITYTDKSRLLIAKSILDDIKAGKVAAAIAADGKIFTHAGISKGVFPELSMSAIEKISTTALRKAKGTAQYDKIYSELVANKLQSQFLQAVKKGDYSGKIFAKGRVEKGNSLSRNERSQGGIFWLRPQEATAAELDLGIPQVVGHNPGFAVRKIWNANFIEADVGRRTGGVGYYVDTPYMTTQPAGILVEQVPAGKIPNLSFKVMAGLKLKAMRDTVADVFLGWNGRIQAIENIKHSEQAVKALVKSLEVQIAERMKAGDTIGAAYLGRQKQELTSTTGRDYLYGGIGFWRDIVMGRQNSVKILDTLIPPKPPGSPPFIPPTPTPDGGQPKGNGNIDNAISIIDKTRNSITKMSNADVERLFGKSKGEIIKALDTSKFNKNNVDIYRKQITSKLNNLIDIVDGGIEQSIVAYLDRNKIARQYTNRIQNKLHEIDRHELPYDASEAERYIMRQSIAIRTPYLDEAYYKKARIPIKEESRRYYYAETTRTPIRTPSTIRTPIRVPDIIRTPAPMPTVPRTPATTRVPTPIVPPPVPVPISRPPTVIKLDGKFTKLTPKEIEGMVAWRQGMWYIAIYPPYERVNRIYSRTPFEGVPIHTGLGSAAKTIIAKYGDIPKSLSFDMGIVRPQVARTKGGAKPTLRFKPIPRDKRGKPKPKTAGRSTVRVVR